MALTAKDKGGGDEMKKLVWDVELKQIYSTEGHSFREYSVIANNAKEAIEKATNVHKRIAKKTFDHLNYICAVSVELIKVITP